MKGFAPVGARKLGTGAANWVLVSQVPSAQKQSVTSRLQRLGFVAGLREDLTGPNNVSGLSFVEQFGSAAAARSELADVVNESAPAPPFAASGIPGARGFGSASSGGFNVAFAKGGYFYLVGAASGPPGATGAPTPATVIAAAQRLYHRVGS
jgi:hypothetical protein